MKSTIQIPDSIAVPAIVLSVIGYVSLIGIATVIGVIVGLGFWLWRSLTGAAPLPRDISGAFGDIE